jgi:hypothetical protein
MAADPDHERFVCGGVSGKIQILRVRLPERCTSGQVGHLEKVGMRPCSSSFVIVILIVIVILKCLVLHEK